MGARTPVQGCSAVRSALTARNGAGHRDRSGPDRGWTVLGGVLDSRHVEGRGALTPYRRTPPFNFGPSSVARGGDPRGKDRVRRVQQWADFPCAPRTVHDITQPVQGGFSLEPAMSSSTEPRFGTRSVERVRRWMPRWTRDGPGLLARVRVRAYTCGRTSLTYIYLLPIPIPTTETFNYLQPLTTTRTYNLQRTVNARTLNLAINIMPNPVLRNLSFPSGEQMPGPVHGKTPPECRCKTGVTGIGAQTGSSSELRSICVLSQPALESNHDQGSQDS